MGYHRSCWLDEHTLNSWVYYLYCTAWFTNWILGRSDEWFLEGNSAHDIITDPHQISEISHSLFFYNVFFAPRFFPRAIGDLPHHQPSTLRSPLRAAVSRPSPLDVRGWSELCSVPAAVHCSQTASWFFACDVSDGFWWHRWIDHIWPYMAIDLADVWTCYRHSPILSLSDSSGQKQIQGLVASPKPLFMKLTTNVSCWRLAIDLSLCWQPVPKLGCWVCKEMKPWDLKRRFAYWHYCWHYCLRHFSSCTASEWFLEKLRSAPPSHEQHSRLSQPSPIFTRLWTRVNLTGWCQKPWVSGFWFQHVSAFPWIMQGQKPWGHRLTGEWRSSYTICYNATQRFFARKPSYQGLGPFKS